MGLTRQSHDYLLHNALHTHGRYVGWILIILIRGVFIEKKGKLFLPSNVVQLLVNTIKMKLSDLEKRIHSIATYHILKRLLKYEMQYFDDALVEKRKKMVAFSFCLSSQLLARRRKIPKESAKKKEVEKTDIKPRSHSHSHRNHHTTQKPTSTA